jgi:hypothetical protein
MKLRVKPIYGWGWFGTDNATVPVPASFEIEAQLLEPSDNSQPFKTAVGQLVGTSNHPLEGRWIWLWQ